jgi:RND family efflux transporter MFP subunit
MTLLSLTPGCGGGAGSTDTKSDIPTAAVSSAIAVSGTLSPVATGYATVSAAVGRTRLIAMPHEGIVGAVAVHDGDSVRADQPLMTIRIAPAAATQFAMASSAVILARQDLARAERLLAEKLATNDQVATARKALADAEQTAAGLKTTGADRAEYTVRAPIAGVVSGLSAVPGDRPQVGAAIALISSRSDMVAQIGLEPSDAVRVMPGATVQLQPAGGGAPIATRLVSVGAGVDATSRLVKAVADIPAADTGRVTLGTTVVASVNLPARSGIVVQRSAILEDAEGTFVYTMEKGVAHRRSVTVAAETDKQALITRGLVAGSQVITGNNAALSDGTAVEETKP